MRTESPRQTYEGKTTSDERAFDLFRIWAGRYMDYEGSTEYDDLAGWAWCLWAERGRRYLGHRKIVRNLGIDALRIHWGRPGTYRADGQKATYPMSSLRTTKLSEEYAPTRFDDFMEVETPLRQEAPNIEAMIDLQRMWNEFGLEPYITNEPNCVEGHDLYDDPRLWKCYSGVRWTAYL